MIINTTQECPDLHPSIRQKHPVLPLRRVSCLLLVVGEGVTRGGVLHRVEEVVLLGDLEGEKSRI